MNHNTAAISVAGGSFALVAVAVAWFLRHIIRQENARVSPAQSRETNERPAAHSGLSAIDEERTSQMSI